MTQAIATADPQPSVVMGYMDLRPSDKSVLWSEVLSCVLHINFILKVLSIKHMDKVV